MINNMKNISIILCLHGVLLMQPSQAQPEKVSDYTVDIVTAFRTDDPARTDFIWAQARAAFVPQDTAYAIMTMSPKRKSGSDVYDNLYQTLSYDTGQTWTEPQAIPSLKIRKIEGYRRSMSDMTPQWHQATQKVLNIGKFFFYTDDLEPDRSHREVAYAVYDPVTREWGASQVLALPATDHDSSVMGAPVAGCVQWLEMPDGEVLLPIFYYKMTPKQAAVASRETFGVENFMNSDELGHVTTVVRCRFDGDKLTYLEHGDELTLKKGRGLYEPSVVFFQGTYFLTLRADQTAYVTKSQDGLHFEKVREWTFDDGSALGSYNTQQHWIAHGDKLFLVYTRRGAHNNHVFRHRAPLFMAQVNPSTLEVIQATEKVLIPEDGVALGNFGVTEVSPSETWVTTTEYWRGEPNNTDNEVIVARILWNKSDGDKQ